MLILVPSLKLPLHGASAAVADPASRWTATPGGMFLRIGCADWAHGLSAVTATSTTAAAPAAHEAARVNLFADDAMAVSLWCEPGERRRHVATLAGFDLRAKRLHVAIGRRCEA